MSENLFQSTLPARGATPPSNAATRASSISIHAPRTGSDLTLQSRGGKSADFNPRSPHGERPAKESSSNLYKVFQSTLPARGATERPRPDYRLWRISIHAPRTGSDVRLFAMWTLTAHFNPRSPHGERLYPPRPFIEIVKISIHAPRTGSDSATNASRFACWNFNPRSPHGERPVMADFHSFDSRFQSTLPARGATTVDTIVTSRKVRFQSTLPARGATRDEKPNGGIHLDFNPRSPHGERLILPDTTFHMAHFNPRPPHGERPP